MALTADRHTPYRDGILVATPVAAAAKIYAGALVLLNGGYAAPGSKAEDLTYWGRAEEFCDNSSGKAGDKSVLVRRHGTFRWKNSAAPGAIEQAQVGSICYIVDDETVTKVKSGATMAGQVIAVDDGGVWVEG